MRPFRVAVIFDQHIYAGGGYQQALNAALLLKEIPSDACELVFFTTFEDNVATLAVHGIQAELINLSIFRKAYNYFRRSISGSIFFTFLRYFDRYSCFERHLVRRKIDLVYFLAPSPWALDLVTINYIATVWDLCHRDDPEFPEIRWNGEFELREKLYRSLLPRATAVFVDSQLGKINVVHRYGIDDERVHVMPFQAASVTRESPSTVCRSSIHVEKKYDLDVPYIFYPAQFWAHKNHIYILEGLHILEKSYGLRIGAIFSGSDKGNLAYVKSYVSNLKLDDRVRFAGFVDNLEILDLYRQSVALVMPSYFGPTNLPPLEAFELGVPVLCLDKHGLRDQVGDAALLMDPHNPVSMANHINDLVNDTRLRYLLIDAGKERLRYLNSIDRIAILKRVLDDFRWRRLTWQ